MTVTLHHGDCAAEIPKLIADGVVVDSVCCDPPYHLTPTVSRFGKAGSAPPKSVMQENRETRDSQYGRLVRGFMGQQWDGGDIAFQPETWATIGNVLRPGGFLVAFGGTRTYHRLASAIEDAGFVVQDCLMWLFATGFPKRRDMLKPAYEPIVLAYKPGGKRTMQVDECRIPTDGEMFTAPQSNPANRRGVVGIAMQATGGAERTHAAQRESIERTQLLGRWPANICHDNSDEVVALFPESASGQPRDDRGKGGFWGASDGVPCGPQYGDSGSAARFFMSAKAGAQDRWGSRHPTVKPIELMKWLVALVTPLSVDGRPGLVLDPFAGSGTTAVAALATGRDAILIEREAGYCDDIRQRLAFYEGGGMHSVQAKNRNRKRSLGPLFDPDYDPEHEAKVSRGGAGA